MAWEFKYFGKISAYDQAERMPDAPALPAFNIDAFGSDSNLKRATRELTRRLLHIVFWLLRFWCPVLRIGRLVVVTRYKDVRDVLGRSDEFPVPYGPEMTSIIRNHNFVLGMDGNDHHKQRELINAVVCFSDTKRIVRHTGEVAENLIRWSGGRIDVMRDLLARTMMEACDEFFGLELEEPNAFLDRTFANSALLFADPFGDPVYRRQTLAAAAYNRHVIDRAIDKAVRNVSSNAPHCPDTLITRLVRQYLQQGKQVDRDEIRAIAIGTITGLVPTNTLGAAKMLEELQRRPDVFEAAVQIAREWKSAVSDSEKESHRENFKKILWELARLNPGLQPGQWRHVEKDTKIAGKQVRRGSVVMVATMSALRDGTHFTDRPNGFVADRPLDKPPLMFGDGDHICLGMYLAMEQIAEVFLVLFSQPRIGWSARPTGWLSYIGPFPRRLDMEFDPEVSPQAQSMISIQVPLRDAAALEAVQGHLVALGNPAGGPLRAALDATGLVHFASLTAFNAADPDDKEKLDPRLLIELNVDGDADKALDRFASETKALLADLVLHAKNGEGSFPEFLGKHRFDLHFHPWGPTGLKYFGTPEFPVTDIEMQERMAVSARSILDKYNQKSDLHARPIEALRHVRETLKQQPSMKAFLTRPSRRRLAISEWIGEGTNLGFTRVLLTRASKYTAALLSSLIVLTSGSIYKILTPDSVGAWLFIVAGGAVALRLLIASTTNDGFARLLDRLAQFQRAAAYPVIVIGGALLIASPIAAVWTLARYLDGIIESLLPSATPWMQSGLALATSIVAVALALWIVVFLWRLRQFVARPLPLLIGFGFLAWLVTYAPKVLFAFASGVLTVVLVTAAIAGALVFLLRRQEEADPSDNRPPEFEKVRTFASHENAKDFAQNHILAVTPLKPGWLRKITLALSLWSIGKLVAYWFRPGFVLNMGTIHYARWFRLPDSESLIFLSNYDGSWESYLEDFITKAHQGQSAVWSHGKGFPRTSYLITGGAEDGARFKRWVRRQQSLTQCWYSRFPHLTTDQIRNNALIHDGLMRGYTDSAARAWLDCFGSMPKPAEKIETNEVQSLVFNGFASLDYTLTGLISLPPSPQQRLDWLEYLVGSKNSAGGTFYPGQVSFGERETGMKGHATFVAFSAAGLELLLNLPREGREDVLSAFPIAFRNGMASRERILHDIDRSHPGNWRWADIADVTEEKIAVHAMLIIYAADPAECRRLWDEHVRKLGADARTCCVETQPNRRTRAARKHSRGGRAFYEHFGFRDGLSQPVIRGTEKSTKLVASTDLVGAGEFILGYQGSSGFTSPAITVPAELDTSDDLSTDVSDFGERFPRFGSAHAPDLRDLGRNGTFLAVRQIDQDVAEFNKFTTSQAKALAGTYADISTTVGSKVDRGWVAAKLMGREKNGSPLIGRPIGKLDNDFEFGKDDPQGLHCPFGAHVRRANPRGALAPGDPAEATIAKRHRLLRRGRTYERAGENGEEKGLLFIGICADIERQFEFLQQTWIGSPSFAGLNNEPDPITTSRPCGVFTIPTVGGSITLRDLPTFTTVKGGGYFFMPSASALRFLAARCR